MIIVRYVGKQELTVTQMWQKEQTREGSANAVKSKACTNVNVLKKMYVLLNMFLKYLKDRFSMQRMVNFLVILLQFTWIIIITNELI